MSESAKEEIVLHIGAITGRQFLIDASPSDTILDVKLKIYQEANLPPESQILVYGEKTLHNNEATLEGYNVRDGARLHLVLQMTGGSLSLSALTAHSHCFRPFAAEN